MSNRELKARLIALVLMSVAAWYAYAELSGRADGVERLAAAMHATAVSRR